ncbi:transposase [Massilia scottii]|uniref:transposase n=1 Tax=Massilia scottii TaxID=3057166 RepID=UPI0035B51D94
MKTGAPWRDIPPHHGPWQSCYARFVRWSSNGTLQHLLKVMQALAEASGISIGMVCAGCDPRQTATKAQQHTRRYPCHRCPSERATIDTQVKTPQQRLRLRLSIRLQFRRLLRFPHAHQVCRFWQGAGGQPKHERRPLHGFEAELCIMSPWGRHLRVVPRSCRPQGKNSMVRLACENGQKN